MATKTVFIASSSESKPVAQILAQELASGPYKPLRWWDSFPAGSLTLPRLLELAKTVDCAVFVLAKDDKTWYRNDAVSTPRDNVLLEYGLFVGCLGVRKCLIVRDPDAKLPTDLAGLSYLALLGDTKTTAERMVSHFSEVFGNTSLPLRPDSLTILADPYIASRQVQDPLPADWLMRSFYLGTEGAKAWFAQSQDPGYHANAGRPVMCRRLNEYLRTRNASFRTFISLGPGDGRLDRDVAGILRDEEPTLQYVPVDISDGILQRAYEELAQYVSVPLGLLTDFEERLNFVRHFLRAYSPGPTFWGLMGGTFGALDHGEFAFANGLKTSLDSDDLLMLEVGLLKEAGGIAAPPSVKGMGPGARLFYAHGASRVLNVPVTDIRMDFENTVTIEMMDEPTDVPGAKVVVFSAEHGSGRRPFAFIRRYDLAALAGWLQEQMGLDVTSERFKLPGPYDQGLLFVRRK